MKILSIKVALDFVILVGLVIFGTIFETHIFSAKTLVGLCVFCFRRSRL